MGFPGGTVVKNPPATQQTQEIWFPSLGREDIRENETATHSSILAWKIPWREEPGSLEARVHGVTRELDTTEHGHTHTHTMLSLFKVDGKGTQSYIYIYPFFPQLPSHLGCHIALVVL